MTRLTARVLLSGVSLLAMATPRAAAPQASPSALRIVVIEGEGAVNVIRHRTAVPPIVEVRDRNDLPVAGAAVTFTISGGNTATFAGGVQTLTVTTNAAGRAAVGALNPLGSGAVQINVQAVFQGQTAAATIAQTNVMTTAEAAAGAGGGASTGTAGSAGGAAGGGSGGGLSALTVGVLAAGAAGGVIVAKEVLGNDGNDRGTGSIRYSGSFSGSGTRVVLSCTQQLANEGRIVIDLSVAGDGSVTGTGEVQGTVSMVAATGTCPEPGNPGNHGCCLPLPQLSGTTAGFTFTGSHPGLAGTTWAYDFAGMLTEPDIVGTFTLSVSGGAQVTLPPVPVRLSKSGP